ncbi:MAG: cell division protein FtsQ/DivIB [bacterium]
MEKPKVFAPSRSKYLVFTADYILPIFLSLAVLTLGYVALYSPVFKVNNILCSLDFRPCDDPNLLAELNKLIGQNIFSLKSSSVTSRLTSGDFTIKNAELRKELPGIIKLELESVNPVVALKLVGDHTWIVLDSRFRVISRRETDPNVPTVMIKQPLTLVVGQPPKDEDVVSTLKLAQKLSDELFTVKTITLISEDNIEITLTSGIVAIFTPKKDELAQLRLLQVVLSDATITKGVSTIDVRFAQPVLRP